MLALPGYRTFLHTYKFRSSKQDDRITQLTVTYKIIHNFFPIYSLHAPQTPDLKAYKFNMQVLFSVTTLLKSSTRFSLMVMQSQALKIENKELSSRHRDL